MPGHSSILKSEKIAMNHLDRPFVQIAINAVDVVLLDSEGRFDPDHFDRYESFVAARDAALTSVEVMLDEGDYDDEEHRLDLEEVREMLESAETFDDLDRQPAYQRFLQSLTPARSAA
jgi:hypothetical protein